MGKHHSGNYDWKLPESLSYPPAAPPVLVTVAIANPTRVQKVELDLTRDPVELTAHFGTAWMEPGDPRIEKAAWIRVVE